MLDEVGSLDATPGTREWAIAVRMELIVALAETTSSGKHLARMLEIFEQHEGWRLLTDKNGLPFASAEEWAQAPQPYGLGRSWLDVRRAATARQRVQQAETGEAQRGGDRKSEQSKEKFSFDLQKDRAEQNGISRPTQRKLDRLARDHPDLHERVKAGELSAHRAAIEAGFIKDNPRVSIPMDNPTSAARIIQERMTPDQIAELIDHLEGVG
jgi:hypothetical protein